MIYPQWLKQPTSPTNFGGPKDVWAIEVKLYMKIGLANKEHIKEQKSEAQFYWDCQVTIASYLVC